MSDWLDPLRQDLARDATSSTWFFRDDDIGWADASLIELLDIFARAGILVDLAAIPAAVTPALALTLRPYIAGRTASIHQHGWSHENHQTSGRRSEFGDSRSPEDIVEDVVRGAERLDDLFVCSVERAFTPPWNRCGQATPALLSELGYHVLSCDTSAHHEPVPGLLQLPIAVDWTRHWRAGGADAVCAALSAAVRDDTRSGEPIGLMVHHEIMGAEEHRALRAVLGLLENHDRAAITSMHAQWTAQPSQQEMSRLQ